MTESTPYLSPDLFESDRSPQDVLAQFGSDFLMAQRQIMRQALPPKASMPNVPDLFEVTPLPFSVSDLVKRPAFKPVVSPESHTEAPQKTPEVPTQPFTYKPPAAPSPPPGYFAEKNYTQIKPTPAPVVDAVKAPKGVRVESGAVPNAKTQDVSAQKEVISPSKLAPVTPDEIETTNRAQGVERRFKERQKKLDDLLNQDKGKVL